MSFALQHNLLAMSKDMDENGIPYHSSEEEEDQSEDEPTRHDSSLHYSGQGFDESEEEEIVYARETRRAHQNSDSRRRSNNNPRYAADDSSIVESDDPIGSDWDFEEDSVVDDRVHHRQNRSQTVRSDKSPGNAAIRQRRHAAPAVAKRPSSVPAAEEPVLRKAGNPILVKGLLPFIHVLFLKWCALACICAFSFLPCSRAV